MKVRRPKPEVKSVGNIRKENGYEPSGERRDSARKVIGLGAVAAISAFAGGLAVAWWNRKTLEKLQNPIPGDGSTHPEFIDMDRESEDVDGF